MKDHAVTPDNVDSVVSELKSINKQLFNIDEEINRMDRDLSNDRKDIEELKINMIKIITQNESIMQMLTRFQVKTADAVKDAVTSANQPVVDQMDKFVEKKVIHIRPPYGIHEKIQEWLTKHYK